MMRLRLAAIFLFLVCLAGIVAAQAPTPTPAAAPTATVIPGSIEVFAPEVLATYPHDPTAYTQGLLLHEGYLYESTGQRGQSDVRQVEIETGAIVQQTALSDSYFGEGLALVDDRLFQITWQEEQAFIYDLETLTPIGLFTYEGEGWGLCYDGEVLWMSDGSATLTRRDPVTFEVIDQIDVTAQGSPVDNLNELECVGDVIYANVYFQDVIVRIDKTTGEITGAIDASQLLTPEARDALFSGEVLNGIAYDADEDVFYITGKHWPTLFEVRFVSVGIIPPPAG
jgi:glutaminyl-peptide cyclotransferase